MYITMVLSLYSYLIKVENFYIYHIVAVWRSEQSLVYIMVRRLFNASPYLNQSWLIVNWTIVNKFQLNLHQDKPILTQEN